MNNFDVLKEMGERNLEIMLAPLDNITNLRKLKAGTQVTIGVAGDQVAALGIEHRFVGGLILANKAQFNELKSELGKQPVRRTTEQICAEIAALEPSAKNYDTADESIGSCIAVGAHDALRWALGLTEQSISENLKAQ